MTAPIDKRNLSQLIETMSRLAPYYTPEWRFSPDHPDPGTALFYMVSEFVQENIKRLNRVPYKHLVAFLNMLNIQQLTARPSHAYLTFSLTGNVEEAVMVPAGTMVAAEAEDGGDDLIFETAQPLLVTPATIQALINTNPRLDHIRTLDAAKLTDSDSDTLFRFFATSAEENEQEHIWYLGHPYVFDVTHESRIELELHHSEKKFKEAEICSQLTNPEYATWSYFSEGEWVQFDEITSRGNRIVLYKDKIRATSVTTIGEHDQYWIRCKVHDQITDPNEQNDRIELDGLTAKVDYTGSSLHFGIAPDRLYYNDLELPNQDFYPFGEIFAPYGTFYIGSKEVLNKRNSWVTLRFHMRFQLNEMVHEEEKINWKLIMKRSEVDKPKPPPIMILKVIWEYWNGEGWVRLFQDQELDTLFYHTADEVRSVKFRCPPDLEPVEVNAETNYWIRVRIVSMENLYAGSFVYLSPFITQIGLSYAYEDQQCLLESSWTYNNLEYKDRSADVRPNGECFKPFYSLDGDAPNVMIGFDEAPRKGPLGLYVSLQERKLTKEQLPQIDFEYLSGKDGFLRWQPLKLIDETNAFTQSGQIRFNGPSDFARTVLFGQDLFWIRAVNRGENIEQQHESDPLVRGLYLNAVEAVQQETILNETPDEAGFPKEGFLLARSPVIHEEVWVDESEVWQEGEDEGLDTDIYRDSDGHVIKAWVKWSPVEDFEFSGPTDRHYVIDRPTGWIRFGNGVNGKMIPNLTADKLKVNYKVGGGVRGNVGSGAITNIQSALAYIESVTNPEHAEGGCELEPIEAAIERGTQFLKHQHRAVTANDFEWIVKEAHPNLAKVKCLTNRNVNMAFEPGCMTVVTLPKHFGEGGQFSEMRKEIEQFLLQRVPVTLSVPGKVRVIEPAYIEISVTATLVVSDLEDVVPVEQEAIQKLEQFLQPIDGNHNRKGWEIGQILHESVFFSLLKMLRNVKYVEQLYLTIVCKEDGQRREISFQEWENMPHGIITSGRHEINVDVEMNKM